MKKFAIERTKRNIPSMWESGGSYTNTGNSIIIANHLGNAKKPVYIRNRGDLCNKHHSLIPIAENDYIIVTDHHRKDFNISIYKIVSIYDNYLDAEIVNTFSDGEWDKDLENKFENAIDSAKRKALHYHCRKSYYIRV